MAFPWWRLVVVVLFVAVSVFFWHYLPGYNLRLEMTLIPLLFAVQTVLADFVESYLLREIGLRGRWFAIIMGPGTILHELSHLLTAFFTGCIITDISFFKVNPRSNVLGYVQYAQPKDSWVALRSFLVGFAPFFACGIILVSLNFLALREEIIIESFTSFTGVLDKLLSITLSYYNADANPLVLLVLVYASICVALGSAPSMTDMKEFFWSLPRHPISGLFFVGLIFTVIQMGEARFEVAGYMLSDIMAFLFDAVVYVQLLSIAVFVAAIPMLFVSDKFIELDLSKKILTLSVAVLFYVALSTVFGLDSKSAAAYAAIVFLALLVILKSSSLFVSSRRPSSLRFS